MWVCGRVREYVYSCVCVASIELEEFDRVAELDRSGPLIVRWHKAAMYMYISTLEWTKWPENGSERVQFYSKPFTDNKCNYMLQDKSKNRYQR